VESFTEIEERVKRMRALLDNFDKELERPMGYDALRIDWVIADLHSEIDALRDVFDPD
jgi:hypothetical protein